MVRRLIDSKRLEQLIALFPVTAILGARQCGKTTLAKTFPSEHFFDLENPRHLARLETPQLTLEGLSGLIVIDEIQRRPDLFPLLRYLVDYQPDQRYLILGSASRDLMQQSSESLAGRIGYYHLGGFHLLDVDDMETLWVRGGYPRAFLAPGEDEAFLWIDYYVSTFLERDIPQLGISIPAPTLRRFWTMISHYHGQELNYSELARSFGISDMTVRKYLEILAGTFMIRLLAPWSGNLSKRLVKRPKVYLRDSGLFHSFMTISSREQLHSHPKLGASWEGFALEQIAFALDKRNEELFFYRTHGGTELDLFWQHGGRNWGIEFKYADAPGRTKSLTTAMKDLNLSHVWIIYPGRESYSLSKDITVCSLRHIQVPWKYPEI
ncbi:MAG: ATP-binding protein [Desulfovibrionales bacterium]